MKILVKRAQKRDADAFAELMQLQMQNMYKTAHAILWNDEDAADAISDTILTCWEKIGQLKAAEFFRTWMTRILINKCNDILRQKKREYPVEEVRESFGELEEYDNVIRLFIHADMDARIRRIARIYDLTDAKAKDLIVKTDKKRASYYNYYSNKKWGAAESYDFCLNSSMLGIEGTADAIKELVALKESDTEKKL